MDELDKGLSIRPRRGAERATYLEAFPRSDARLGDGGAPGGALVLDLASAASKRLADRDLDANEVAEGNMRQVLFVFDGPDLSHAQPPRQARNLLHRQGRSRCT